MSAGFTRKAADCATRALAIAAQRPYREVWNAITAMAERERKGKRKSNPETGVYRKTFDQVCAHYGGKWIPTMRIGSGCKTHLLASELPTGRIVARVSRHFVAVIDGVIQDKFDPSRNGSRCVYGYYLFPK